MKIMIKILLFIAVLYSIAGRKFQTEFKFSLLGKNRGWVYLDKMTFAPGQAQVNIQTYTSGLPYGRDSQLFIQAISQYKWDNQLQNLCNNPVRMPLSVHKITLNGQKTTSKFLFGIDDYQTIYFVMKDCQSRFLSDYNNSNLNLHIKLHLLNNKKQIGQQEDHWYVIVLIISAGISLVLFYFKEYRYIQYTDWSKLLLFAGTVTQISSLCWKSFGFLIYTFTGSDFVFFHYIYLLLHSTSQAAIISLIILLSYGWTLTFNYDKQFQLYIPVGISIYLFLVGALGIINVIITMITKIGHSHDRHHVFDSIGGILLGYYRVFVLVIFIFGCIRTYRKTRYNLKLFVIKLLILGGLYISSMPVVVLGANYWVQAKNRHQFVFILVQSIKFLTNLILAFEFNYKKSQYNKINFNNSSFIPQDDPHFR